ncbi:endonuclease/exonuclease/phosphatase family protein [Streptomyces iconiensis]|uniref:Endonuclease/exonuclease/phosphatase family protein n=1 Tax=Streptomyces iconiensis TaxID=1384038 RepID=A0ABT6ZNH8_9ACTN|nr:endonuclease/exonuclease/phosphatase family protein [Streptomyces iconiensis]MDJ1130590.1 endonuclease/exonuclease/phosphatase family protein [Streptomyces iconiensis]
MRLPRLQPRAALTRLARLLPVGVLLAVSLTVVDLPGASTPAHAAATDRTVGSWNMEGQFQGGDGRPESRWHTSVQPRLNDGVEVVALQEAGNEPPGRWTDRVFPQPGVAEHIWQMGTETRPDVVNIYWGSTGQQRNGLAIVTRETAVDAVVLPVHSDNDNDDSRPIMGVQIGNDWYFTGHARSHGGRANDNALMYQAAEEFMERQHPGQDWLMLADFNNGPASLPQPLQDRVIAADEPTQEGGGELDFFMSGQRTNGTLSVERRGISSDHFLLTIAQQNCRRDGADCDAVPLPGRSYHYFSAHEQDKLITLGWPSLYEFDEKKDKEDGTDFRVNVRYSDVPGRYLLSFGKTGYTWCIDRDSDNYHTSAAGCDPSKESQHWELTADRIHSPNLGAELQPGGARGDDLIVNTKPYYWLPKEVDTLQRAGVSERGMPAPPGDGDGPTTPRSGDTPPDPGSGDSPTTPDTTDAGDALGDAADAIGTALGAG